MSRKARVVDAREFNGRIFRRYPEAKDMASRNYWRTGGSPRKGIMPLSLHREMWSAANGPIPTGYEVHHKDGNPLNTVLDNLECLSPEEHAQRHRDDPKLREWQRQHLASIRPNHRDWMKTDEARAAVSARSKELWAAAETVKRACKRCGETFETRVMGRAAEVCSAYCQRVTWRERTTAERTCAVCGKVYTCYRHAKGRTCSRRCTVRLTWQTRHAAQ